MASTPAQSYNVDRETAIEQRRFGPAWLWIGLLLVGGGGLMLGGSSYVGTSGLSQDVAKLAERVAKLEASVEASQNGTERRLDTIERKLDQLLGWRENASSPRP